ncbi:MAG: EF-P beta-lysylation protein EpmB [Moraxella sp.]
MTQHFLIKQPIKTNKPQISNWQNELQNAICDIHQLCQLLDIETPTNYQPNFPLKVPLAFVQKMQKGNPNDPLLLQVLPSMQETLPTIGYTNDPLHEHSHNPIKGLLHKYQSRVLITLTGVCAINCRYCFRQHFDYGANLPTNTEIEKIYQYIQHDNKIKEVIFSGGDPLNLSNRRLKIWFEMLSRLPQIQTIRLHTRLPVVLASRIDDELLDLFKSYQKNIVMVLHINHPQEIDKNLKKQCQLLKDAGVTLLNQSVLLKNINDDVQTLIQLSYDLFNNDIIPYYLHILDKVNGAAHFDIPIKKAINIYWELLENLSGYLVPKLVQELPDKPYKTPINIYQFL